MLGMLVALISVLLYLAIIGVRLGRGWPILEVLWDRDILQFFLTGMMLFGLGLVGEYVGRIHEQVRGRPRYLVHSVLEHEPGKPAWQPKPSSSLTTK